MKFGHSFKQALKNEGFPPDWVDSAISYQQLKKCINRLTNELAELGLDPQTLKRLLKQVEDYNASKSLEDDRPLEYLLSQEEDGLASGSGEKRKPFHPKLLFYVNEITGELDSARLDEETRQKLQMLAIGTGMTNLRVVQDPESPQTEPDSADYLQKGTGIGRRPGYRTVEVPLTSDSEFFTKLADALSGLEVLQEREEQRMHNEITELGKQVARLTNPDRRANKKLIAVWRQIFQIYVESDIFFGSTETDHGSRDSEHARDKFQQFANTIAQQGLVDRFKKPENLRALNMFMHVNREILQGLRFGEINRTAMMKILKSTSTTTTILLAEEGAKAAISNSHSEFDKQTALGVKTTFPRRISYPEFSQHLAKAVCAEVNTQILSNVPRLDDYSCPMCMEIKWRPVRLRCQHVFCIRCLIVMQTNKQHKCPLCRERTVVDANARKFLYISFLSVFRRKLPRNFLVWL